jgi:hypothetical protein
MESSIELINEIKELGKGIFKFTVEYYCTKIDNLKTEMISFTAPSGKMAIAMLNTTLTKSGADIDCIEVTDYFYTETLTVKHTVESVTKKVKVEKEIKVIEA